MRKITKPLPALILIGLLILGAAIFIYQKSKKESSQLQLETQYSNPFKNESQYVNPFDEYKNPFDVIRANEQK